MSPKTHTRQQLNDYANQNNPNSKAYEAKTANDKKTSKGVRKQAVKRQTETLGKISCFDSAAEGFCQGTPSVYHGMMLGLAAGMSSRYYIRSNRESGEGRFDLVLEPKIHTLPGIIMEFKAVKEEEKLSESAKDALAQINTKQYDTDLRDRGIGEIAKYGIAFCGKKVEIAV